ncbi:MAG TPA: NADH-quinone oxidoreductase subunit G [Micromonosporaceae bacterium]
MVKPTAKPGEVALTIDGMEVTAPKGELIIRTAERYGIEIPRFCDHPLLEPAGACRQCLVEVEGQRKPVASCTQPVADGMVVKTQLTSPVAKKAQAGIMELLLINHPLDCPMCDKGGECPLQNQAMSSGRPDSRFLEHKREYVKPINISAQVLLDRERCVLCQRCTRFSEEIAGDKFIDLIERSADEQIGTFGTSSFGQGAPAFEGEPTGPASHDDPFNSYFSGNTVQICPVGALTGVQYRFRSRPFDLVSSPSVCEHCSAGCAQRTDHRRGTVMRRLAGDDPAVNEEWNCDKGRWGFQYATAADRITTPLVRDARTGALREASWPEALRVAAEGLLRARDGGAGEADGEGGRGGVAVLTGGRLTVEDAYAYAKFARAALRTNDIDFRARPLAPAGAVGGEEAQFLASTVVGTVDVTYSDVDSAPAVVLVGLEPEDECPILFLRLRKARRRKSLAVLALAPYTTRGLAKLGATVLTAAPGEEAGILTDAEEVRTALAKPGAVLFVGERLATVRGGLSAAVRLAEQTGCKLAWVPRRAGDRGAVDAGCLPNLLPGARPVGDATGRAELTAAWGLAPGDIPAQPGRDTDAIIAAAAAGGLGALVVAGVDVDDLADPALAARALESVEVVVSLEVRRSFVTDRASVVLPVAPVVEKDGTFLNWEGRLRTFATVLASSAMTDGRVLDALASEMGVEIGCRDVSAIRRELRALSRTGAVRAAAPAVSAGVSAVAAAALESASSGQARAVLATWPQLIDAGRGMDGDDVLRQTARPAVVRLSKRSAADLGVADGDPVRISSDRGWLTLPAAITEIADGVVWLPTNSPGAAVRHTLGVTEGAVVTLAREEGA